MKKFTNESKQNKKTNGNGIWLYGFHAVVAALKNPERKINRLLVTKETLPELTLSLNEKPVHEVVSRADLEQILPKNSVHQGIACLTQPLPEKFIEDIPEKESSLIVLLDQVSDPHNIGAIMRSAAAFNADAVLITEKNAPEATGALAKSASGALELLPLISVVNLARTMNDLQKRGYWCVGMDGSAPKTLKETDLPKKIVLVMGSEGYGLRRLTTENCDFMVKLPISSKVESLNVSNACAIALYDISCRLNES